MALSKLTLTTPLIGDHPHQPSEFAFSKREFGRQTKVKQSFQGTWFKQWSWLHYVEEKDTVFCCLCVKAYRENKLTVVLLFRLLSPEGLVTGKKLVLS